MIYYTLCINIDKQTARFAALIYLKIDVDPLAVYSKKKNLCEISCSLYLIKAILKSVEIFVILSGRFSLACLLVQRNHSNNWNYGWGTLLLMGQTGICLVAYVCKWLSLDRKCDFVGVKVHCLSIGFSLVSHFVCS